MGIQIRRLTGLAMLLAVSGLVVSGCGNDEGTTTIETKASGGAAPLEIRLDDYAFIPANGQAKAGKTLISAPNEGAVEHELVLFRTDMNPAKLPTEADGSVDEEKMDKVAEGAGELADVEAGDTKSGAFDLKPGKYVMFCNLPGHYALGMYGTLTVNK